MIPLIIFISSDFATKEEIIENNKIIHTLLKVFVLNKTDLTALQSSGEVWDVGFKLFLRDITVSDTKMSKPHVRAKWFHWCKNNDNYGCKDADNVDDDSPPFL